MVSSVATNVELEAHPLPTGNFQYTRVGIHKLEEEGASEFTLVTIVNDISSSVSAYEKEMEECIKRVVQACQSSPRADNLMIRHLLFHSNIIEGHGFRLLANCNLGDYDGCLKTGGTTALYDAVVNAIEATGDYGKTLTDNDIDVNGIIVVVTDGCNNASSVDDPSFVKQVLQKENRSERLESLMVILVGVGVDSDKFVKDTLNNFYKEGGLTQFVTIKDATAKELAKLADFVSQSISSQSSALGTGQASQPISPKF